MKLTSTKLLVLLLLALTCAPATAQNKYADSLRQVLRNKSSDDTTLIYTWSRLAWEYTQQDSVLYYYKKASEVADLLLKKHKPGTVPYVSVELATARIGVDRGWNDFLHGRNEEARKLFEASIATSSRYKDHPDPFYKRKAKRVYAIALQDMGPTYSVEGNYTQSIGFYQQALLIYKEINDEISIASTYSNMGIDYNLQGMTAKALDCYFKALDVQEKKGETHDVAITLVNLASVYKKQKNYKQALDYYFKALGINKKLNNKRIEANLYGNIGSIYTSLKDYSKALDYNFRALHLNASIDNKRGEAINKNSIGLIYDEKKQYDSALAYLIPALKIDEEYKYSDGAAVTAGNIGRILTGMKKYVEAEAYLRKGLLYAPGSSLEAARELHQNLYKLYELTKQTGPAFEHFKLSMQLRDSINNKENLKAQTQAEMNYEFDKKQAIAKVEQDKKDAVAYEEQRKQQIIIVAVSAGLILMLILAGVIFRSLRTNQKNNRIIQQQKEDVENQKAIVEEKHKEITDSINYAERIQRSFLASDELLHEGLKDHFVFFKPKDVVSGDFYWAGRLSNGNFAYITADSTGHGVPGAIMSILNISSLEKATETESEPAPILNATRKIIIDRLKKDGSPEGGKDGMDCNLVVIEKNGRQLTYAAANNPLWIVRENTLLEFKADKMPVGKSDKDMMPFTQHGIALQQNDVVYTFTDGMPDQFGGEKGKKYMHKRLKEFLISIAGLPLNEQKEKLMKEFAGWKQNLEQVDDVCVIGFRVN